MMDHSEAVRQKATERYLLNELDPDLRDQFEEHLFDCQECALDVRAGVMFVEQSKVALADRPTLVTKPVTSAVPAKAGFFSWFKPAFAVPVFALLLVVVGYQNLVEVPHLQMAASQPQLLPSVFINVSTRAAVGKAEITTSPDKGFFLNLGLPPDKTYATYNLELHNPSGGLEWADKIPASSPDDTRSLHIPGFRLQQGTYNLVVTGTTTTGQNASLGTFPVDVKIQK